MELMKTKFDLSKINYSRSDISRRIKIPTHMTEDLAEEIGLHIGDGTMNYYKNKGFYQLRGHIIDDREHYESRIKELYFKLYNLNVRNRNMKSTGVYGFQIWSQAMVEFKNKVLELPLGKKINIQIPKQISNFVLFSSLIRGLFDTDGCLYIENKRGKPYPKIEIKTISKILSKQLSNSLQNNEINCTVHEQVPNNTNWNRVYLIVVRGEKEVNKWKKIIGSNNPTKIKKFNLVDQM